MRRRKFKAGGNVALMRAQHNDPTRGIGVLMGWEGNNPEYRSRLGAFVREFA
jgi:hypothetical protein